MEASKGYGRTLSIFVTLSVKECTRSGILGNAVNEAYFALFPIGAIMLV